MEKCASVNDAADFHNVHGWFRKTNGNGKYDKERQQITIITEELYLEFRSTN